MAVKIVRNDIKKMNVDAVVDFIIMDTSGENFNVISINDNNYSSRKVINAYMSSFYDEEELRIMYCKCLEKAISDDIKNIAFPIKAVLNGEFSKEDAIRLILDEINKSNIENDMFIYLVLPEDNPDKTKDNLGKELNLYIETQLRENTPQPKNTILFGSRISKTKEKKGALKKASQSLFNDKRQQDDSEVCFFERPNEPCYEYSFDEEQESKLDERMKHVADSFSTYLLYLIKEHNMENSEVYKRALVDKKIFSKLKNNENYHPQKITALRLCVGAKLNLDETKDLLARAGYALSPCDKTDIIFAFFIENEIYDMVELDIQLEEHGLPCIIS